MLCACGQDDASRSGSINKSQSSSDSTRHDSGDDHTGAEPDQTPVSSPVPTLDPTPEPTPIPSPDPTPTTIPTPQPDDPSLEDDQNFALKDLAGKASKLSEHFKGNYLLLDMSSSSCGACLSLAEQHDKNTDFQDMFKEGGKCSFALLVEQRDLSAWVRNFESSGFIAKNSYGIEIPLGQAASAFGFTLEYIPTVLLIDKKGNLIDSAVGEDPKKVNELCR